MNRNFLLALVIIVAGAAGYYLYKKELGPSPTPPPPTPDLAPPGAHLFEGMGSYSMPISKNAELQRWFDQGLNLAYGFNHDAAERSFLKATELDPQCAMCWWGAALVLGPHVNAPMDPTNNAKAWERVQKASQLAAKADAREQAYIQALSARYAQNIRQPIACRSIEPMPMRWRSSCSNIRTISTRRRCTPSR